MASVYAPDNDGSAQSNSSLNSKDSGSRCAKTKPYQSVAAFIKAQETDTNKVELPEKVSETTARKEGHADRPKYCSTAELLESPDPN